MKRLLIVLGVLTVVGLLARSAAPKLGNVDWEQKLESMPDTAPPKWMYRNLTAIRANTERMITLLEGQAGAGIHAGTVTSDDRGDESATTPPRAGADDVRAS